MDIATKQNKTKHNTTQHNTTKQNKREQNAAEQQRRRNQEIGAGIKSKNGRRTVKHLSCGRTRQAWPGVFCCVSNRPQSVCWCRLFF